MSRGQHARSALGPYSEICILLVLRQLEIGGVHVVI